MSDDLLDGERIPAAPAPPGPAPSELHFDKKTTLVRLLRAKDPSVHQRLFAIRPLLQLFPIIDLFTWDQSSPLGPEGAQALLFGMVGNTAVQTLDLRFAQLADRGLLSIASIFDTNTSVRTLDIGHNLLTAASGRPLARMLRNKHRLQIVSLRGNELEGDGVAALAPALADAPTLQSLSLTANHMGTVGLEAIGTALGKSPSLRSIDLSINNLTAGPGVKALSDGLATNSCLTILNLKDNMISDEGLKTLEKGLVANSTLQSLTLNRNNITAASGTSLANILKSSTTLVSLYLGENELGAMGVTAVAEALKQNTTLHTLDVSRNIISEDAAAPLAGMLKVNVCLEVLHISGNPMETTDGLSKLCDGLEANYTLHSLLFAWDAMDLPKHGIDFITRNVHIHNRWNRRRDALRVMRAADAIEQANAVKKKQAAEASQETAEPMDVKEAEGKDADGTGAGAGAGAGAAAKKHKSSGSSAPLEMLARAFSSRKKDSSDSGDVLSDKLVQMALQFL